MGVPEILHESQGLSIRRNSRNGFCVARLHYTADPRKRSEEWRQAAMRGMSKAQFEREFEINYQAGLGERAFPEIYDRRHEIILSEGPYFEGLWPGHLAMWGGFDYGANNPSSFHVYTVVDSITYAIWELYQPCRNIIEFAKLMKDCPYWEQIRYIVHDPDIASLKQRDLKTGDVTSVKAQFETLGITRWVTGLTDESAWISRMRQHWCGPLVTFKILQTCPMMIDEFEKATFRSVSEKQLETSNYSEALVDKHNHALDDCKYFMNSGIRSEVRRIKLPNMVQGFGWGQRPAFVPIPGRQRELGLIA